MLGVQMIWLSISTSKILTADLKFASKSKKAAPAKAGPAPAGDAPAGAAPADAAPADGAAPVVSADDA